MFNELDYFDFSQEPGKRKTKRSIINDGKPLISVITPYYNAQKYIQQTANCLYNQTFPYWEWIIVDDGSTENGTEEFLENLKKQDSRIIILHQKNSGPAAARYYAAQNATTDIVLQLDADDLIDKTLLECGYWTMKTNPNATWAYADNLGFSDLNYLWKQTFDTIKEKKQNIVCLTSFIRKEKFLELKELANLPKSVHEDWYMWLYFLSKGYQPIKMGFYGFWYRRMHTGRLNSISSDKQKTKIAEKYLDKYRKKIVNKVNAIQYPRTDKYDFSTHPYEFKWNRRPLNMEKNGKRLLFVLPWMTMGGADKFNLQLLEGLNKKGYEITIITTEVSKYIWRQKFEKYATEVFDLTTFLNRKDWAAFIIYIIKSRQIDLVMQSNSFYGYYFIPYLKCVLPDLPVIDYIHMEEWNWRDGGYPRDSVAIENYLDATYTCTKYLKDIMYEKMGRTVKNIEPVYIGTDEKYFDPENIAIPSDEKWYQKIKGKKVVLFPCRITEQKRPFLMIEILYRLLKKRDDVLFLVLGDGNLLNQLKERTKDLQIENNIIFLGAHNDIRRFYKIADATLICSMAEGLTLTAYESLAMNVPVISSDVGGQRELVNNSCGRIVKLYQDQAKDTSNINYSDKEINEYVNSINDVLNDSNLRKNNNCRNRILSGFTVDQMVDKMEQNISYFTKNGSQIDKTVCKYKNLAERYLILFNEVSKKYYYNPDEPEKKATLSQRLWRHKSWRILIKVLKKLRIIQTFKKYILKTDKQLIK